MTNKYQKIAQFKPSKMTYIVMLLVYQFTLFVFTCVRAAYVYSKNVKK